MADTISSDADLKLNQVQELQHNPVLTGVQAGLDACISSLRGLDHPRYKDALSALDEAREVLCKLRGLQ